MGWKWEHQAPQMPHMNNIDLAVSPAMYKHHSALLKAYSKKWHLQTKFGKRASRSGVS